MRTIEIPELALVVLIGVSGSGKSTFGRSHFLPTEILSSDFFRGLVSDDENDQTSTNDAFDVLYYMLDKRLARGKLTVVDATNVRAEDRKRLIEHARKYHCFAVAIVVDTPESVCQERNKLRPDRNFGPHVIRRQQTELKRSLRGLEKEGFRFVHILQSPEDCNIRRIPLWSNKKHESGPFDIIGDVHGCADELRILLTQLGWESYVGSHTELWGDECWRHPLGRKAIFLGDLADRGPDVLQTIQIVHNMVEAGVAFSIVGNHDEKFLRWLRGRDVQVKHGLDVSIASVDHLSQENRKQLAAFLDGLISHYVLDTGRLVVAHAGLREEMHGRSSGAVREFCMYGETTGETDDFGLPVRYNWASEYRGKAMVVYGHTPVPRPEWLNNTINIDTGAVFGGALTALRYPERELVSINPAREYCQPARPFRTSVHEARSSQHELDDVLDMEDVAGKRIVETRLQRSVTIREENSVAALEVMSRFAIDPHWLIYLPPTMSPCETSSRLEYLEYPTEAFAYFRKNGVGRVICEEKHMGSRSVVVVCRNQQAARNRFGVTDGSLGACYTRTGRAFFTEANLEIEFLKRLQTALSKADFWNEFSSDWFCLDCELMPWSAKAQELIRRQYAAVGAAGEASLSAAMEEIANSPTAAELALKYGEKLDCVKKYRDAYRRYCWPVLSLNDYRLAPFHLLASEGFVHSDKSHIWHMQTLHRLASFDFPFLVATAFIEVDTGNDTEVQQAAAWWEQRTNSGGEGMVVKPLDFIATGSRGILQPAVKCRGREYLRIIYGPEYTNDDQMPKLRPRGLSSKRSLALREFALGIESLDRFVSRQPLRRVHECVFGVLALESEPVDPRL